MGSFTGQLNGFLPICSLLLIGNWIANVNRDIWKRCVQIWINLLLFWISKSYGATAWSGFSLPAKSSDLIKKKHKQKEYIQHRVTHVVLGDLCSEEHREDLLMGKMVLLIEIYYKIRAAKQGSGVGVKGSAYLTDCTSLVPKDGGCYRPLKFHTIFNNVSGPPIEYCEV